MREPFVTHYNAGRSQMKVRGPSRRFLKTEIAVLLVVVSILAWAVINLPSIIPGISEPSAAVCMLLGFSPLVCWFLLLVSVLLLFSFLSGSIENVFSENDDRSYPERNTKTKWSISRNIVPPLTAAHYLSLTEHSPPASAVV